MEPALPDDIAVRADGVSKVFRLPHEQVHTLKERVVHPTRRRRFEALQALHKVSFDVRRGEFFGIVGRNGSGKSTLMKCLSGIYRADEGEMWMRGRMAPFIELGVGFNPELTARDNVLINAIMLGLTPAEARERYDEIIGFAELEEFVDLKLKNYSSGMHVRLAFSVMVHVDADVLLIDEVLAVGDAAFQQKCHDALTRIHREGRTILLVTHDMEQVQRFCDRAILLHRGRPIALGDAAAVTRRYLEINFEAEPSDHEMDGRLESIAVAEDDGAEGDGSASITASWCQYGSGQHTDAVRHGESCALCMRVRFRRNVVDPVFGFVLFDDQRRRVFSATTEWDRLETGSFQVDEEVNVAVTFDNWLAPGRYFASPQVAHAGTGLQLMARQDEGISFVVMGGRAGAGVVDIPHTFLVAPADSPQANVRPPWQYVPEKAG